MKETIISSRYKNFVEQFKAALVIATSKTKFLVFVRFDSLVTVWLIGN